MNGLTISAALLMAHYGSLLWAQNDTDTGAVTATEFVKMHVRYLASNRFLQLKETYAARVKLLPGHQFLQAEYSFVDASRINEGQTVDRGKLMLTIQDEWGSLSETPDEQVDEFLEACTFAVVDAAPGDHAETPSDPVQTKDGKLHFAMEKGDKLVRVETDDDERVFFQCRKIDGGWRVVAEYID